MYGGAAVLYGSKRQHCISLSSTEAEIVTASHAAAEAIYLRGLLAKVGHGEAHATQGLWSSQRSGVLAMIAAC
eukprot:741054-Pleurochrysis_carterae.AAC.2